MAVVRSQLGARWSRWRTLWTDPRAHSTHQLVSRPAPRSGRVSSRWLQLRRPPRCLIPTTRMDVASWM